MILRARKAGNETIQIRRRPGDAAKNRLFLSKNIAQMHTQDFVSKEFVLSAIQSMPDRILLDDLFDEIIYIYKIEVGLEQSKRGIGITLEEMREKVKKWRAEKSS